MFTTRKIITLAAIVAVIILAGWSIIQPARWNVVASYSSSLSGRTDAQIHNLEIAIRAIDGKLLPAGQEFSFNRCVGSWTADRGYVKAPVSYDGELIPAWGGGVCQASSTLYNAALLAGLDIIERHRHMFSAKYVPPGQDAAVAQYDIDLRLKNPYGWPVKVAAEVVGERVVCRLLSQHKINKQISIEREISQMTAPGEVVKLSGNGSGKRTRIINHGQPGMRVAVYRRISDGGHSSRYLISENTYPAMNRLIRME